MSTEEETYVELKAEEFRYFKRWAFYGDYQAVEPKHHITVQDNLPAGRKQFYGVFVALCGYTYNNIIGGADVRRTRPKVDTICLVCENARKAKVTKRRI